jgi:multiple sugar transport system substrate-binding protein
VQAVDGVIEAGARAGPQAAPGGDLAPITCRGLRVPRRSGSDAMQITRRTLARLITVSAGSGLVTACGAAGGARQAPPEGAGGAPQGKITWLVRATQVENDWEQNVVLPKMGERFPWIEISLEINAAEVAWNEKVFAMHAAGTPPDVHNGIVGTFIQLYAQEKLLDLTPLIARDKVDLKPFGGFERDPDMCRSGKQWSLPILTTLGNMTIYNVNLIDQAGLPRPPTSWQDKSWNWDRVLEIGRRTTQNWGQPDAVYGYFPFNQFHPWAYLWGGDPWAKEWYAKGIARESAWTAPEVQESAQFWQDLAMKHQIAPRRGATTRPFREGGAVLWGTTGWNTSQLGDVSLFKWSIAPLPWKVTNKALSFTDGVVITNLSKAPEAAWQLVKYVTSQEGQLDWSNATLRPPTRVDAFEPWLELTLKLPGADFGSKEHLREVVTGYLGNHIDNWAHYVVDARRFQEIQGEAEAKLLAGEVAAGPLLADVKVRMEAQLRETYEQWKNTRLVRDTLCQ